MMPTDMPRDPNAWLVLYDGECGFCRWALARLLSLDRRRRLRPVPLAGAEADTLLADLTPERRNESWHLVSPSGERRSGGAAVPSLLRLLPGGRVPADLLGRAPRLTERAYRWVAEHRSTLSRLIPESAKRSADRRIDAAQAANSAGSSAAR
jgi:predicted DCC family thiol-disulfide oxidoreductase YuxK